MALRPRCFGRYLPLLNKVVCLNKTSKQKGEQNNIEEMKRNDLISLRTRELIQRKKCMITFTG